MVQTPFGPREQSVPVEIDEDTLRAIAEETGGQYFRATDNEGLAEVYKAIDKLEATKIETQQYTQFREFYKFFIVLAMMLAMAGLFAMQTIWRRLP